MHAFYGNAAELLWRAHKEAQWASSQLSEHQAVLALPYPPSTALLQQLHSAAITAEHNISQLQLDIKTALRRRVDASDLQQRLSVLQAELRSSSTVPDLMRERGRLYALARAHFPELLRASPGSAWSGNADVNSKCQVWASDVGIDNGVASSAASQRGLLADGRKLSHFTSYTSVPSSGSKRVYRAVDADGHEWAIKEFDARHESHRRQLFRQVGLLDTLRHPQLAAVHAVFEDSRICGGGEAVFLQVPWYSGGDLAGWLGTKQPADRALADCVQIIRDVMLALQHLHAGGHVHCDIKPGKHSTSNVFLTRAGRAVLGDFDGVRQMDASLSMSTVTAATLHYLALEVKSGAVVQFTPACDMYSAGVMAAEVFGSVLLNDNQARERDVLLSGLQQEVPAWRLSATNALALPLLSKGAPTEPQRQCVVCAEVKPLSEGVLCAVAVEDEQHFNCDDCLAGWVCALASEEQGQKSQLMRQGGLVHCMGRGCGSGAFDAHTIAMHITPEAHALYQLAKEQVARSDESRRLQAEHNAVIAAMRQEFMTTLAANEAEQAARQGELHVVDTILTLHCPTCNAAFLDFTGCFALTCGTCGGAFCGWCLMPCGNNAHPHVRVCPSKVDGGTSDYHHTFDAFKQVQNVRRSRLLWVYLLGVGSAELRRAIERRLQPHLRDLGM
ncbi:kinase-like domain-containing protein, partial [Tribonema minus]